LFSVKGFAAGMSVAQYSVSAVVAIAVISIAAMIAARKPAGSSVELRTVVTAKLLKEDLIKGTVRKPTGNGWRRFPLWIKVPPRNLLQAISSRR
jgi:hypothetical protein